MVRTFVRALCALVALLALLAGLPAVLGLGTWAVLHHARPQQTSLTQLLTTPDNGNLFLWALVVVGWIAWLAFALSVLVEIPAQLRGRMPRRLPTLGWSQRLAGGLVGAVLALLPMAGGALAATGAPPPRLTVSAPLTPTTDAPEYTGVADADPARHPGAAPAGASVREDDHRQHLPHYTVRATRPAESLWSIAEHALGSGERWREIAELNEGRVMDARHHVFDADRPIEPGWKLLLPADARLSATAAAVPAAVPAAAPAVAPAARQVTVRPGDTLSDIAEREMGTSADWPRLYAANRGVAAPDGHRLTDPNLIEPGMRLTIPGVGVPVPPTGQPVPTPTPASTHGQPPGPAPTPTPTPTPTVTPSPHPTAHPTAPPSTPPTAQPTPTTVQPAGHSGGSQSLGQFGVAAGTSVLGAILLGAVALRRSRRRTAPPHPPQHRIARVERPAAPVRPRPAQPMARPAAQPTRPSPAPLPTAPLPTAPLPTAPLPSAPPPPAPAEPEPVQQQAGRDLDLLGRALRSMARNVAREGRRLPPLNVVRVTAAHTIELHLVAPAPPVAPFRAAHASTVWWCTPDAPGLLGPDAAAVVPSPYPALVSLGETVDGATVLVDLEAIRLLHISGEPRDVARVLRTLALELTFTPLADRVGVHVVGVAEELASVADDRLVVHPDLEHAVAALQHRDASVRSALLRANAATPREARSRGVGGEEWAPEVVLCAGYPTGPTPEALGRLLDARPRGSVAVVTAAPPMGTGPVARWTLPASGSGVVPGLEMDIALQKLDDETYDRWLRLLGANVVPPATPSPIPNPSPAPSPSWPDPSAPDLLTPLGVTGPASEPGPPAAPSATAARMAAGHQLTSRHAPAAVPAPAPAPAPEPVEYGEQGPQQRLSSDPWILALLATPPGSGTPANPQLRIIGPVELVGAAGPVEPERRAALIEAAARRAVGPAQGAYVSADAIGRLREWLGDGPEGRPVNLRCDWDDFQALCARGLSDNGPSGDTALARALALVRGAPFAETAYPWAEALRRGITGAVVDVAHELTLRRLRAGDHRGGEAAAVRGLVVDPDAELLLRDLICLYADSGSGLPLQRTVARLESKAARTGVPLEPESAALLDELRTPTDHLMPRR